MGSGTWGGEEEVRYQFYAAVGVDLESFDMFAYSGEQSQTNFLEKYIQDTLIR